MGKNDKGSKHTGYNKGLPDSSTQKLERDPIEQKSKGTNRYGNLRNVEEGSNKHLSSFANSVSKPSLLGSQEGRGSPSSHKFERIKQKHTLPALQNGGLALSKVHIATGRLHVQARHEGRLFLSPPKQKLKGKSSFSVVRETIRVPLPLFRPGSCTKDLYKNLKSSHVAFKAIEHSNNHISGRHVITGENNGGDLSSQRHTNLSVATSGVCNKSKEISTRTTTKNGISGLNNRFSEPLIVTNRTKTAESKKLLCGDAQGDQSFLFRVDKTSRAAVFNCSSSTTSTTTTSVFATTSDSHTATRTLLLPTNHSESKIQTRINMVDSKFKPLQWKVPCTTSNTDDNSNGCLQDRVGSCLSGRKNEGCVVGTGAKTPYQYIRTVSSEISPFEFYKEQNSEQYSLPNRQHDSNKILDKNGRDEKCETGEPGQRDLGISFRSWDHNYHRIPSECNECDSRTGVQGKDGLFRMDAMSKSFFSDLQTYGDPRDRSFCLTQFSSASALHSLASRSLQPGNRCHATELVRKVSLSIPSIKVSLFIPSILSHKQDSPESNQRKNINDDFDNSNMALSTMVPPTSAHVDRKTSAFTKTKQFTQKSFRQSTSLSGKQNSKVSGMENLRKRLSLSGISTTASKLISKSRRDSSTGNYESSWRKWVGWCSKEQIHPISCDVNYILNFLGELFEAGYEYRTINCHRSVISAYHNLIGGKILGVHPKVCELLTGNQRPPQPKHTFIWDVQVVLDYMKENWADNKIISDKHLIYKLTMLLALVSTSRAVQLQHLQISHMGRLFDQYKFSYNKLHKGWRKGKPSLSVKFFAYKEDHQMCVVKCLDEYLLRSKEWRTENKKQLLLSHINPHREVSSSTISRWIKETSELSGVTELGSFSGHSTRSASTSKAELSGLAVSDILNRGSWSNESTWQKFYHKEVIPLEQTFQRTVLGT